MMENIFIVPAMQHGNRAKPIKHCNKIWEIRERNFLISRVVMELYNFVKKKKKNWKNERIRSKIKILHYTCMQLGRCNAKNHGHIVCISIFLRKAILRVFEPKPILRAASWGIRGQLTGSPSISSPEPANLLVGVRNRDLWARFDARNLVLSVPQLLSQR